MASFRSHLSLGIALGVLGALCIPLMTVVPNTWDNMLLFLVAITIGAQMPDMDSDSGIPFHVTFGSLAIVASGLTGIYAFQKAEGDLMITGLCAASAFVIVWIILGSIFKKWTKHRGMAHSTPAALFAGLLTLTIATHLETENTLAVCLAAALTSGYLAHLVLDELHAATNFHGRPFIPNKSLGSALKWTSKNKAITLALYVAIAILIMYNSSTLVLAKTILKHTV